MSDFNGFKFIIPGKGVAKERPRFNGKTKTTYTPERTETFETEVAWRCRAGMKVAKCKMTRDPVAVEITVYRNRKKGDEGHRPIDNGDVDNIAKSILDAMNKVAYLDDKQVTTLTSMKRFITSTDAPHISVTVYKDQDFE